jgi:hypothetical protein
VTNEELHDKILMLSARSEMAAIKTILFELLRKIKEVGGDK